MCAQTVYLRPLGLVPFTGSTADDRSSTVLPLCGGMPFGFTMLEMIERDGHHINRRRVALAELWDLDARGAHLDAGSILDRLTLPRRRIAGLKLDSPQIMGVINVTPDSFSDGGRLGSVSEAIEHGLRLAAEGATVLDIGGESTRPGSDPTPLAVELERVIPVIEGLAGRTDALISVDTRKAEVIHRAVRAGAGMINDVSALTYDPEALPAAAESGLPVCLMHALGDPKTMQDDPRYVDVLTDVYDYLAGRVAACEAAGIGRERIVIDPGIGFGKTFMHNLELMSGLALYHGIGCPLLLGASRKRFIGAITGEAEAGRRALGSVGAALAGAAQGAHFIRAHDVRETRQALQVFMAALLGRHGEAAGALP